MPKSTLCLVLETLAVATLEPTNDRNYNNKRLNVPFTIKPHAEITKLICERLNGRPLIIAPLISSEMLGYRSPDWYSSHRGTASSLNCLGMAKACLALRRTKKIAKCSLGRLI